MPKERKPNDVRPPETTGAEIQIEPPFDEFAPLRKRKDAKELILLCAATGHLIEKTFCAAELNDEETEFLIKYLKDKIYTFGVDLPSQAAQQRKREASA